MATESIVLRTIEDRDKRIQWSSKSSLHRDIETRAGHVLIRHGTFRGGVSEGVEIVRMANEHLQVDVLPTRGMALWRMQRGSTRFGWYSPVLGPVHPMHVPVTEPSGLGWLSGFDELVVRCGLESNGAPVHDGRGQLKYPLHGHVGNTPADSLSIEFDEASGRVDLVGEVIESRLFFKRWRMRTRVRLHADGEDVELLDDITNDAGTLMPMQLLYHINVGPPVLGAGSQLLMAAEELAPKDAHAAEQIDAWTKFEGPQTGYAERVYFARPRVDESGQSHALLVDRDQKLGLGVSFKGSTLPYFVLWKNTADAADGYVTGLEPATNFPNGRDFEASQGRVVSVAPGQTKSFRVRLRPMTEPAAIASMAHKIKSLGQSGEPTMVHTQPREGWSEPAVSPSLDGSHVD